jgi:DNA polymerase
MADRANPDLAAEVAAAFAWWREAGVDCAFRDEPASWLATPVAAAHVAAEQHEAPTREASSPAAPSSSPAIDAAALPQELAAFVGWWLAEPWLDDGRVAGRVPPRGEPGAAVMVIVPEPEKEDRDRLLSGPQGRLLDAILGAMGVALDQAYVASALPRHMPMADWRGLAARGLGEVLAHHVNLVGPRRLIAFGDNILPLLRNDPPNSGQVSLRFNHEGLSIPLLAASDLAVLLARPRAKARLWQQWLDWTGTDTT